MKADTPKSTPDVLQPERETSSVHDNKGCCVEAQPVVDSGMAGPGYWSGDGQSVVFHEVKQ